MKRSALDLCLLCANKAADKKGSHIIPGFIVNTGINHKGSRIRDKELMVIMRNRGFNETYFGRNVPAEAIQEFKGRELTDEEIEANNNPNIVDHFFCSECEKKLAVIEGHFANEIYNDVKVNGFVKDHYDQGYELVTLPLPESRIFRLFFTTVVWRMSIAKNSSFKLKEELNEKLRRLLNNCLDLEIDIVVENCKNNFEQLTKYPLIIAFANNEDGKANGAVYSDDCRIPHFAVLNEFILLFYERERQLKSPALPLYGLNDLLDKNAVINLMEEEAKMAILSVEESNKFKSEIIKVWMNAMREEIRICFSQLHEMCFGFRPPKDVVYAITYRIVHSETSQADKYSFDNIEKQMVDFMLEYQDYLVKHGHFPRYQIGDEIPK